MNQDYEKYLKYKKKYINLKKELSGGKPGSWFSRKDVPMEEVQQVAPPPIEAQANAPNEAVLPVSPKKLSVSGAFSRAASAIGSQAKSAVGTAVVNYKLNSEYDTSSITLDEKIKLYKANPTIPEFNKVVDLKTDCEDKATKVRKSGKKATCSRLPLSMEQLTVNQKNMEEISTLYNSNAGNGYREDPAQMTDLIRQKTICDDALATLNEYPYMVGDYRCDDLPSKS